MSVAMQPAFVLHRRPYRETSWIVDLFTQDHGRIAAVARGFRKARSRNAAFLQPFMPLSVSWYGRGDLLTLSQVEANGFLGTFSGKNLRCGFYLNELLMRLLPKHDPHARLFMIYRQTLEALQAASSAEKLSEKALRLFEKNLLMEIGYGLPLNKDLCFEVEVHYCFHPEQGFLPSSVPGQKSAILGRPAVFSGKALNALLTEDFEDSGNLQEMKRLMRLMLNSLLGRPLESRSLFEYQLEREEHG